MRIYEKSCSVVFAVAGVFFALYGVLGGGQDDATFGLACLAFAKGCDASARIVEGEGR